MLAFFNANDTHGRPGCGGQVTREGVARSKYQVQKATVHTHICTKCS